MYYRELRKPTLDNHTNICQKEIRKTWKTWNTDEPQTWHETRNANLQSLKANQIVLLREKRDRSARVALLIEEV
jgi:hypothetical protein